MKIIKFLILIIFLGIFFSNSLILPTDVLNNIPSFSENEWIRPHNSLLADPIYQFEPWRNFAKNELLSGHFPLWNPYNGNGSPFFANPQTAVLYPLNVIYYVLPIPMSLVLIPFLKLFFFSLFSFLYFRQMKISKGLVLVGTGFSFIFPFMTVWLLWPHTNVFLFFPFILYLTEKIQTEHEKRYRYEALLIISYAFSIFGGHPETLFIMLVAHILYIFFKKYNREDMWVVIRSILIGFLLGAVQLAPFMEYLLNSYALEARTNISQVSSLPIQAIVLNIFPFLLGGPHLEYYRPIHMSTNFQETLGGYVGLLMILIACVGAIRFRAIQSVYVWTLIGIISFVLSYNILPDLFYKVPVFQQNANQRFIGILGFSILTIALLTLESFSRIEIRANIKKLTQGVLISLLLILLAGCIYIIFFSKILLLHSFLPFIFWHSIYILISTLCGIYILFFSKLKSKIKIIVILIFIQIIPVLITYNPVVSKNDYYTEIPLVSLLNKYPIGTVMEVGNPSLPADVNLIYKISNAVNNDALEVNNYKTSFDIAFSDKNIWKNPDTVTHKALVDFGIQYVLSDYDIRLLKKNINADTNTVLNPIDINHLEIINLKNESGILSQIRFLPATFNRKNNCNLMISLTDITEDQILYTTMVRCEDLRNYMFHTVSIPEAVLSSNHEYVVEFKSDSKSQDNRVSLVGQPKKPYLDLLLQDENKINFELLGKTKSIHLFSVAGSQFIKINGKHAVIENKSSKLIFDTVTEASQDIFIAKTFYPGWNATIDGNPVKISTVGPRIKIHLPAGEHRIRIFYRPISFYVGLLISFVALIGVSMYFIQTESNHGLWKRINNRWKMWAKNSTQKISEGEHILVFMTTTIVSVVLYRYLIVLLHIKFLSPHTDTINWVTVHSYPKQQDVIIFGLGFIFVTVLASIAWLVWIWIRIKK